MVVAKTESIYKETDDTTSSSKLPVKIIDTCGLRIYYPNYSRIDLVCDKMPEKSEESVVFVFAAAFTAGTEAERQQGPVAGDHVSGGQRRKGYSCKRNTGAFVWYDGKAKFLYEEYSPDLDEAAFHGGCGFAQEMMIHDGRIVPHTRGDSNENEFRALCLMDGRVAIAESKGISTFRDFINNLQAAGATEALYLDMGPGWNYSWYRDETDTPTEIHTVPSKSATNWITFYK